MNNTQLYIEQQLGSTGMAICHPSVAYKIRRDLWPVPFQCATDFSARDLMRVLTERAPVLFLFDANGLQGFGGAFCADAKRLEERIALLYGMAFKVTIVDSLGSESAPAIHETQKLTERQLEHLDALRKLAAQDPPLHSCALRHEILEARAKLAAL